MGAVADYHFRDFPYLNNGATQLKSGHVIVEEGAGGWIPRHLELDGVGKLGAATRAVISSWLHMERQHDLGIRRLLASKAAER